MKVCMVAYTFYETDNRVRRYAETLAKRGDEVEAIVLRREGQPPVEMVEGVRVFRIQKRTRDERGPFSYLTKLLAFLVRSAWLLTRRHVSRRYDLIHVHSVPDFEVFASLVPRLTGAKVILDIHDIVPELYASKFRIGHQSLAFRALVLMERASLGFAHHVIVANHLWRNRLVERSVRASRASTILNYPDPRIFRFAPRQRGADGQFVMCYPGTLSLHQGVDLIVEAMAVLRDEIPGLRLIVAGDGSERVRLMARAKDLRLSERVEFIKGIPLPQVAAMMREVDLGVEPKRKSSFANEALSTKILEFMAMGVPVLASDTLVHEMYFGDRVAYFESENVPALAAQIRRLYEDRELRDSLIRRGLAFLEENNWDVKKHEYLDLVDQLVHGAVTPAALANNEMPVPLQGD